MLPYRTVLRLAVGSDAIRIAEQELEGWLAEKIPATHRHELKDGQLFRPGHYDLGGGRQIDSVRVDRDEDDSRRLMVRWVEETKSGTWEVSFAAMEFPAGRHPSALVIEAQRVDDPNASGVVDPPRVVRRLLEREEVFDGRARITAQPLLIGPDEVIDVYQAILDPERTASVIVAASLGRDYDGPFREQVRQLTAKVVGLAAVFFLTQEAVLELNEILPVSHQVEPGRVRTYLPGVDVETPWDARRHRVLGPVSFARSIKNGRVSQGLQMAYAVQTRGLLLQRQLPREIRRGLEVLTDELVKQGRRAKIDERTSVALRVDVPVEPSQAPSLVQKAQGVIQRWLRRNSPIVEGDLVELDAFIAKQVATAETFLEEADRLEQELGEEKVGREDLQRDRDELELELVVAQEEATDLRRKVEYLQGRLKEVGDFEAATANLAPDDDWKVPSDVVELAESLRAGASEQHRAFVRVEFTGDISVVQEVQKRDQVGRYVNAFWEFVQVLYDYAECRMAGYSGGVHAYLADEEVSGKKCPQRRHAPTESDSVVSRATWREERNLPVPQQVSDSGRVLMLAHFKPTHENAFAPRLHYFDDTSGSGKIYIGYIGRHLSNTKTSST